MNDLDKLTQVQKDSISYNSSIMSLYKREYEKARKEVQEHEHNNSRRKHISREQSGDC